MNILIGAMIQRRGVVMQTDIMKANIQLMIRNIWLPIFSMNLA